VQREVPPAQARFSGAGSGGLTVTEPPIEEVIGRVLAGRSVMSSIIRKARVLLSSTMPICWSIGPSYFVGFVWEPPRPDGSLIEAAQGGQFGLGPLDFAHFSRGFHH